MLVDPHYPRFVMFCLNILLSECIGKQKQDYCQFQYCSCVCQNALECGTASVLQYTFWRNESSFNFRHIGIHNYVCENVHSRELELNDNYSTSLPINSSWI